MLVRLDSSCSVVKDKLRVGTMRGCFDWLSDLRIFDEASARGWGSGLAGCGALLLLFEFSALMKLTMLSQRLKSLLNSSWRAGALVKVLLIFLKTGADILTNLYKKLTYLNAPLSIEIKNNLLGFLKHIRIVQVWIAMAFYDAICGCWVTLWGISITYGCWLYIVRWDMISTVFYSLLSSVNFYVSFNILEMIV